MRVVIDPPRVLGRAGARCQTRDQHIEAVGTKAVRDERAPIGHIAEANFRSCPAVRVIPLQRIANAVRSPPDHADDAMSTRHQCPHGRAADRTGGTKHENATAPRAIESIDPHAPHHNRRDP